MVDAQDGKGVSSSGLPIVAVGHGGGGGRGGLFCSRLSGSEEDDEGACSMDAYVEERSGVADGGYFGFRWMIQAVFVEGTVLGVVVAVGGGWWLFLFSISSSLAQRALNGLISPRIWRPRVRLSWARGLIFVFSC